MEHIAAVLLIVACSDAGCRELPAPVSVFETVEECQVELEPAVSVYVTRHPQVFAKCVEVDPALEEEDAELVWDIGPDGALEASLEAADVRIASEPSPEAGLHRR